MIKWKTSGKYVKIKHSENSSEQVTNADAFIRLIRIKEVPCEIAKSNKQWKERIMSIYDKTGTFKGPLRV